MENISEGKPETEETDIQALTRITVAGFERMIKGFERMNQGFERMDWWFDKINARFDSLDHEKRIGALEVQ